MRERYEGISPAEFFKKNKHVAGFQNPTRAVYQTVKELVENSLDATENHGIPPTIHLTIEVVDRERMHVRITCKDNGIGIPPNEVPNVFGRVLYGSKYVERQSRGVFGLGVKMAVLYAQMTTGEPVEVETTPLGSSERHFFRIKIDTKSNEPIVLERRKVNGSNGSGTTVSLTILGDWGRSRSAVLEYVRRTHTLCPYVEMVVRYPDGDRNQRLVLVRKSDRLPPPPKPILPHIYGVDLDTLKHMVESEKPGTTVLEFLARRFSGVGRATARAILRVAEVRERRSVKSLKDEELLRIVRATSSVRIPPPPPVAVSPVGADNIEVGLREAFKPEFAAAVTRKPRAYGGHPFVVEVGLAYGGGIQPSEKPLLLRFANKIPLIYDEGVDVATSVVSEIDWSRYRVAFPAPLVVLTHIASTKVPFHGLGKEAVADVPEIREELKQALQECCRRLRLFISEKLSREAHMRRFTSIAKYIPTVSHYISMVTGDSEEELKNYFMKLLSSKIEVVEDG